MIHQRWTYKIITLPTMLLLAVSFAGCEPDPPQVTDMTEETAFAEHESTAIGARLAELAAEHPDESGFGIIRYGQPALASRIALADLAEKSLDVQYYIWEADATGRLLTERLLHAADRGVRVRVLVDDINLSGRDERIAALDAHPSIEVRLFNPFKHRKFRVLDFATDLARVNHRMHNKIMIMDNAISLVGGRNIGAHYFQSHAESNFRDLDIVGVGPIVRETSSVFDRFWNGPWAIPITELVDRTYTQDDYRSAAEALRQEIKDDNYTLPIEEDAQALRDRLEDIFAELVWAPGEIIWEDPANTYAEDSLGQMNEALHEKLRELKQELLIESAYFVPRERGIEAAKALRDRGVRVRVLTNSLTANDVLAAHAGYSKYRKDLLRAGVELYELRPYPGPVDQKVVSTQSKSGLHTKAIVFDREAVFIGSFNLDPRSANINTEAGIYVESEELAKQVMDYMAEGVAPENAFRVLLDDDDDLRWVIEKDGFRLDYENDPNSSWYQRWMAGLIRMLPVEKQL